MVRRAGEQRISAGGWVWSRQKVPMRWLSRRPLSTSARYVGMLYAGAVIFSEAVFQTLRGVTGGTGLSWVSFGASLAQMGDVIFRVEPRYDTPWEVSLLAVVLVIALSAWVLARRVRGVEIVT